MIWILDSINELDQVTPSSFNVYLKGGTCVQHFLRSEAQRFSKDLDLGVVFRNEILETEKSRLSNFRIIEAYINKLNKHLSKSGYTADNGLFNARQGIPESWIICYDRFYKAKHSVPRYHGLQKKKGNWVMVEFSTLEYDPKFAPQKIKLLPALYSGIEIEFPCATRSRILADKTIAMAGEKYGEREEIKDVLDVYTMLRNKEFDNDIQGACRLIKSYADRKEVELSRMLNRAKKTVSRLAEEMTDERLATDVNALLPRERRFGTIDEWKKLCEELKDRLSSFPIK